MNKSITITKEELIESLYKPSDFILKGAFNTKNINHPCKYIGYRFLSTGINEPRMLLN